jgi:thymidine kinase
MANLIFKYSAMNGGKTINILQTAHNYEENNFKITIIKSKIDTKGKDSIISRNGEARKVDILLRENESLLTEGNYKKYYTSKVILVDEVEMLSESQIEELWTIAHLIKIPVITYGLKSNFTGNIFSPAVAKLFAVADDISEIGSSCLCLCGKKAIFNSRRVNGVFTDQGETVVIDGSTSDVEYVPLCGDCYLKYVKMKDKHVKKLTDLVNKVL